MCNFRKLLLQVNKLRLKIRAPLVNGRSIIVFAGLLKFMSYLPGDVNIS